MKRTDPFTQKQYPFASLAKSLQKWCCWPQEQESKDDLTSPLLKFITLF